jgi:hypothetical protein
MFVVLTAVTIPLAIGFARGFGAVFDIPFQHYRSWAAIRKIRTVPA